MADTDNSAGAVFIELGLDLNKLESDFIAADETIQQNLARLNRESNLIQLRTDVEIGNLDDAEKILEVKTRALNEQLKIQRDRIALTEAAYKQLVDTKGKTATATQNMEARLQREQLALQRLEGKLRDVTKAQENLNKSSSAGAQGEAGKNPLLSMYNNIKGDVLSKIGDLGSEFGNLGKVASLADGAITGVIGAIGRIPTPVTAAVGAIAGLTLGIKAVEDALLSMAEPAITTGDTFWVASRGAQMTVKDFEELSTICKVTGIELNEVTNALKRVNMQVVNGGTASKVLEKWGVEVRYANGELKNALDMSVAIADGLERAKAAGKGKDFIAGVFGKGASGDIVTYLEDLKGNIEAANDIVRNGLFDPERAHNVQGLINSMNTQAEQLGSTFSSALVPVAEKLVPKITERMGDLTKVIENNAETIQRLGYAVGEAVEFVGELTSKTVNLLAQTADFIVTPKKDDKYALFESFKDDKSIKEDAIVTEWKKRRKAAEEAEEAFKKAERAANRAIGKSEIEKTKEELEKAQKALDDANQSRDLAHKKMLENHGKFTSDKMWEKYLEGLSESERRILDFSEREKSIKKSQISLAAQMVEEYQEHARATEEQIEKEKKLKSALEDREESTKRIEQYTDELSKIKLDLKFGDDNYQKSLAELEQWYKEATRIAGTNWAERIQIEQLYKAKLEKLQQEPAKKVADLISETADIEFERTHTAFEKQIRDIEKWRDAQLKKARTAEEVSAIIKNAAEKESKAFADEMDKIKGKVQTLQEKIFEQEHSERANKAMQLQKERFELYNAGIYDPEDIERFYWNAAKKEKLGKWAYRDLYSQIQEQTNANMERFGDNIPNPKQQNNISAPDFQKISQDFQAKLTAPIQIVSDSVKGLNLSIGNVDGLFKNVGDSAMLLSNTLIDAANKISELQIYQPNKPADKNTQNKTPQSDNSSQPQTQNADNKDNPNKAKDTAKNSSVNDSLRELSKKFAGFDEINKKLIELTKVAGNIAQVVSQKQKVQPPNITVSPNINVNLGGAYVFDNAMKLQLTDDITSEVADAVKEAVELGINQFNSSFGN